MGGGGSRMPNIDDVDRWLAWESEGSRECVWGAGPEPGRRYVKKICCYHAGGRAGLVVHGVGGGVLFAREQGSDVMLMRAGIM